MTAYKMGRCKAITRLRTIDGDTATDFFNDVVQI